MSLPRKVVIVGQGYVGLPLAMRAVEVGYQVVGFDKDPHRVERLAAASSYVEDVTSAQLSSALAQRPLPADHRARPNWAPSKWPSSRCPRRCEKAAPTSPSWKRQGGPWRST